MLNLDGDAAGQASHRPAKLHFLLMMVVTPLWCSVSVIATLSLRRSPGVQLPSLKNYAKNSSLERNLVYFSTQ
jgi:hypothetical protein